MENLYDQIPDKFKAAFRDFMAERAEPAIVETPRYPWQEEHYPWESYNHYGWRDYSILEHMRGYYDDKIPCPLVVPEGVVYRDLSYSQFEGTFTDDSHTLGLNAWGGGEESPTQIHCRCNRYSGLMIRYEGSLKDALLDIMGRA